MKFKVIFLNFKIQYQVWHGIGYSNLFQHMAEVNIENLESNYDHILSLVGQDSYIEWDTFTKSSTGLTKQIDELAKTLSIYRDIQQRRFIINMKKLKGYDIPDLVKTVKAKKLPKEALKSITSRFTLNGDKVELVESADKLKEEATQIFKDYISSNEVLGAKIKETAVLIQERIKESGLYEELPEPKELVSTFKHSFSEDRLEVAKSTIQVEYLPGTVDTLHIKTYAQIVDATLELAKPEYKRLTNEARSKQRKIAMDTKEYVDSLVEYLTNTEVLIVEGQKSIAGKLGITPQKWEESEGMLMERGLAQNLLMIQSSLRTRVKESMVPEKEATLDQAKEILSFQVSKLKTDVEKFKKMFSHLEKTQENYQLIPMLLALALNDMVFEKYELEEEDFMKNVGDNVIMTNPEIMGVFREMEVAIIKLMQELGIISPEAGNYMQQQTQFQSGSPTPNLLAGMQPGTNPLELLQLQQMQQFEQMQKMQSSQKPQPPK